MSGNGVQQFIFNSFRNIHQSTRCFENKIKESSNTHVKDVDNLGKGNISAEAGAPQSFESKSNMVNIKSFDRYFFVWLKKYKSLSDVPARVPSAVLENVHSRMRIRIANIIMVCGLIGCGYAIISGKKSAEEGDTPVERLIDRNKRLRAEYLQELEKQKQQKDN